MRRAGVAALGAVMLLFGIPAFWGDGQSGAIGAGAPPPPPSAALSSAPGTHPIWPGGNTVSKPVYRTATDLARDFAIHVLGVPEPTVSEPASMGGTGIGTVTISLPSGNRALAVLTQRQVDGSWVIIQVGDQSRLEGITLLPGGKPGPVMTIHPPSGATSGDVTEVTADGTYEIHLTAEDLRAGVAHLVAPNDLSVALGAPIHTVLILYRDSKNGVLDALGGEFG